MSDERGMVGSKIKEAEKEKWIPRILAPCTEGAARLVHGPDQVWCSRLPSEVQAGGANQKLYIYIYIYMYALACVTQESSH